MAVDTEFAKQYAKLELPLLMEKTEDEEVRNACAHFLDFINKMGPFTLHNVYGYDRVDALKQILVLTSLARITNKDENALHELDVLETAIKKEIENTMGGR